MGVRKRQIRGMSDNSSTVPAPVPGIPQLKPVDVFFALASDVRWAIIGMLADGRTLTATQVAAVLGRDFDGVAKQLRVMRECGVLAWCNGEDRRLTFFYIPAENRRVPGVLDYGVCTVRVETALPVVAKD